MPNQFGELTDEEIFGTAAAALPPTSLPPAVPATPAGELSDDEVFGTAAAPPAPAPAPQEGGGIGDLFRQAGDIVFRTIGGGIRDAVQNTSDFLLDIPRQPHIQALMAAPTLGPQVLAGVKTPEQAGQDVRQFGEAADEFQRQARLPEVPKPDDLLNQFVRGGVQLGTGMVAPGGALRQMAPQMVPALRGALSGAVADLTATSPTDPNLSNLVQDITGVPIATAIDPKDNPFLNRFRNVVEGAGIGSAFEIGLSALGRAFARSRGKAEATDLTPEEVEEFSVSPEVQEFMAAHGITDARDPRVGVLEERVAARREAEAQRPGLPGEGRAEGVSIRAFKRDQDRLAAEREAIEAGEMDPAAASTAGLAPRRAPDVITVDPAGRARTGTPDEEAMGIVADRNRNLPLPVEPQVRPMAPDEVARARAAMDGGNANTAAPPARMVAPEGRAPQTADDVQGQREAEQAFALAARQRQRAGDDIRDTQPAGRPEGANQQEVFLDDDFPVQILETRMVPDSRGRMVQVAKVQRYDPRTGQPDPGAPEYEVPMRQLRRAQYAVEPRLAQDFVERAESPRNPEAPRMPHEGVRQEPDQTYRTTAPDPNEQFPGAGSGRSPFPEQPDGPGPWRERPQNEEEVIRRYEEARAREEARRAAGEDIRDEGPRPGDARASNTPRGQDADGRFEVDDRGFVVSSRGGPIRFADQKQAAKWILRQGNAKSPDQVFELANHPSGKGFTVRERGRTEPPRGGRADEAPDVSRPESPDMGQADMGQPRTLPPPEAPRAAAEPPRDAQGRKLNPEQPRMPDEPVRREEPAAQRDGGINARPPAWDAGPREIVTPSGRAVMVEDVIVEADELLSSDRPGYPQELQPRDRSRAASDAQIADIAARLDPERLGANRLASEGAPVIGRDGVVESGNGRVMALRRAYEAGGSRAEAYRRFLEARGFDTTGFRSPIWVRRRVGDMTPEERAAFTREANERSTAAMSATERARADAAALSDETLALYRGGDVELAGNREFVRAFMSDTVSAADRGTMIGPDGALSVEGIRRIQNALLARAYDDVNVLRVLTEATDNNIKAIGGALMDAAGVWARMRAGARAGEIDAGLDITRHVTDAAKLVREARNQGVPVSDLVRQTDVFSGGVDPRTETILRMMFRDDKLTRPRGRDAIAGTLRFYAGEALKADNTTGRLFGDSGPNADDILKYARQRLERSDNAGRPQGTLFGQGQGARATGPRRPEGGQEASRSGAGEPGPATDQPRDADAGQAADEVGPPPGSKLYSGLPLDFMADEAKRLFGWTARGAEAWRKSMEKFAREHAAWLRDGKLARVPGQSLYQAVLGDATAEVRGIAAKLPTEKARKIANDIIDEWFVESGTTRGAARTYDEAVSSREVSRINELGEILGKFLDDDAALEQIVRLVRNPSQIRRGTAMGDAALGIQRFLREELEYLRAAGVEVGEVKSGYFPRSVDEIKVRRDPAGFVEKATEAYRRAGLSQKEAREAAESWRSHILYGDNSSILVPPGGTIDANFVKGRVLPKEADNILSDFLINDPKFALVHYITRAARRAEFTRRINGDAAWQKANARYIRDKGSATNARWQQMVETLEREGAGYAVPHLRNYIATMAGVKPTGLAARSVSLLSWARTWGTLGLLEKATLTSIPEAAMPGIRAGHPADLARSIGYTIAQVTKHSAKSTARARELAEDLGMVVAHGNYILSAARFVGGDISSKLQQEILQTYFRNTGLERFTNATRVAAVGVGQTFLRRMAREMATSPNISKSLLAELGVPKDKADAFSKWLLSHKDGLPDTAALASGDKAMADMYRTALIRFTNQSIMRPGPGTRPRWASHPFGATVFHLLNYTWAFQKNVLNRPFRLMRDKELSPLEKARVAAPIVGMMPVLWAIQGLVSEGRDALFGDPTRTEPRSAQERTMLWLSRAGLTGKMDPFVNIATGVRYGRDVATSVLGPVFGRAATGAQTAIEYITRNSERTNAAERKMAKTAYDLAVEPAINYLLSALPAGSVAAAVARQTAGSGTAREAFTEAIAGPPEKGGRSTGRTTGRQPVERTTGRTTGRNTR